MSILLLKTKSLIQPRQKIYYCFTLLIADQSLDVARTGSKFFYFVNDHQNLKSNLSARNIEGHLGDKLINFIHCPRM